MSYELGQQAALEKVGVFKAWTDQTASLPRLPPVRARGADYGETARNAIANVKNKYMARAPKASRKLIAHLNTSRRSHRNAPVERLSVGPTQGDTLPNSAYDVSERQLNMGSGDAFRGTLMHELGHSTPGGGDLSGMDLADRVIEEARATNHAANVLGRNHPDVPPLLTYFGTYLEQESPFKGVAPKAPPKLQAIIEKYRPYDDVSPTQTPAWKSRFGTRARQLEQQDARDRRATDLLFQQQDADYERLRDRLRAEGKHDLARKLGKLLDDRQLAIRGKDLAASRQRNLPFYDESEPLKESILKKQQVLRRMYTPPEPTLADYAKLQGAEREQLDSWIASMRDKIDQHFWAGAGDTALAPILQRLEQLRST